MQQVDELDWGAFYLQCPSFGHFWVDTHDPTKDWPVGIKVISNRVYFEEKLCVPFILQNPYIRKYHDHLGHVGATRLWDGLSRVCLFSDEKEA